MIHRTERLQQVATMPGFPDETEKLCSTTYDHRPITAKFRFRVRAQVPMFPNALHAALYRRSGFKMEAMRATSRREGSARRNRGPATTRGGDGPCSIRKFMQRREGDARLPKGDQCVRLPSGRQPPPQRGEQFRASAAPGADYSVSRDKHRNGRNESDKQTIRMAAR